MSRYAIKHYCYAIKHLPSGGYLPARKNGRGFSFDVPSTDKFPRLFNSLRSAQNALSAWLQGEWIKFSSQSHDDPYVEYYHAPKKVESRKREEMAVVEMEVKEK